MREIPFQRYKNFKNREEATACPQTHTERNARLQAKIISSGGNSLFPVGGGRSLLNFRQNFQISYKPPPPFALEKAVFSPFIGQNFRKFVIFHEEYVSCKQGY